MFIDIKSQVGAMSVAMAFGLIALIIGTGTFLTFHEKIFDFFGSLLPIVSQSVLDSFISSFSSLLSFGYQLGFIIPFATIFTILKLVVLFEIAYLAWRFIIKIMNWITG